MIKFFRTMRRDFIEEGKMLKYFKYAVGETALVVVGILIALNINNQNKVRIDKDAEQNFYSNTKQQLLDDAGNIRGQIQYNNTNGEQFQYAMDIIDKQDRNQKDSLGRIGLNLLNYSDFDRQGNIYETMVNSGEIKLLQNQEIIERLRQLEETYIYINRMESIHLDVVMELSPHLIQSISFKSGQVHDEEFLFGFQFQNFFVLSARIMGEKDAVYHRALDEINELVELLDSEID
ncbi:hypothetical protein [Flagellimonas allohymeniacidonis]|uniref:Uncharacterized protein n=1 Tax=Flagellimonas allohymeniacidonis TaxID=2517819 RepID=A0A4Q8QEF8_9FLAO|nr:hypothetical protein [Allomuricauda hymeniacidonis]TAI48831.1 hypothetical protein EW142_03260 [Allomuricauda hymeniacidonis]